MTNTSTTHTPRRKPRPAATTATSPPTLDNEDCILVLQGGGALGAYQAGVFEALDAGLQQPNWVAGISIGAINAALIAGNAPGQRVARLREFWELVSAALTVPPAMPFSLPFSLPFAPAFASPFTLWGLPAASRVVLNEASANRAVLLGVPGFFSPRLPPAPFQPPGTAGAISYYDTTPLRETLERLVDFDRLNSGAVRLSVGAVNVRSGNFAYFDTAHQRIDVRHILASGALPPGFAPVEIDGEHYWDGGIVSNTPLQYVLDQPGNRPRTVFQVDLFAAAGALPANLDEVSEREKDIRFSSRTRQGTTVELDWQVIALAAQRLAAKLPAALQNDPDLQQLAGLGCQGAVDVVHLIYRSKHYESQSKDYEFSRLSMQEHWASGQADMAHTLHDPRWLQRQPSATGVRVFDLTGDRPVLLKTRA